MRYHNITKDDMLNGGRTACRTVGGPAASHCCRECQNPITWDPNGGLPFTEAEENEIFAELGQGLYQWGSLFSGGDPSPSVEYFGSDGLLPAKSVRNIPRRRSGFTQALFGREIQCEEIVNYLDVCVDGEFRGGEKRRYSAMEGLFQPESDQCALLPSAREGSCFIRSKAGT